MDNTKDDARRRLRTLHTIGNAPSPSVDFYSQNESGLNHKDNSVKHGRPWHWIRPWACGEIWTKASQDYEEALAVQQEQIAMTGGHVGQARTQLEALVGAPYKRARRPRLCLCAYGCHGSPQRAVEASVQHRNCKFISVSR